MIDRKHCAGCRDDYYNGGAGLNGVCWRREDAKIVTRYRIHRDTMPGQKGAFTKMRVPNCKYGNGWYYYDALPNFVKASDVIRSKAGA